MDRAHRGAGYRGTAEGEIRAQNAPQRRLQGHRLAHHLVVHYEGEEAPPDALDAVGGR